MQSLHESLPWGAPQWIRKEQSRQMRLLHGSGGPGHGARLRGQVRDQVFALRQTRSHDRRAQERHAKAMAAMATEVTLRQPVAGPKAKP